MRKIFQTIVLVLFIYPSSAWSQMTIEQYTSSSFFSDAQDRITLFGNPIEMMGENFEMIHIYLKNGTQKGDTVYYNFYDYRTEQTLLYTFIIKKFGIDSVLITPLSEAAKNFYSKRNQIKFYNKEYFFDNSISFERLYYHSGIESNINSNVTELGIDSNRNVKLRLRSVLDSSFKYFSGKLTEDGYQQLVKFLKTDNLKTLFWPASDFKGMDPKRLILYFNGQRKELTLADSTPAIVMNLLLFFSSIKKFSVLNENSDIINFDQ